jgi:hypothetical protein
LLLSLKFKLLNRSKYLPVVNIHNNEVVINI